MKPVDKKDRPKLILMICLSVCCFGYGIVTLATDPALKPVAPAKTEEKEVAKETPAEASPAAPTGPDPFTDSLKALEGVSEPVLVRDPFLAQVLVAAAPPPPPATTPKLSQTDVALLNLSRRAQTLRRVLGLEVSLPNNKDSSETPAGPKSTPPLELLPPPAPALKVTGILVAEGSQGKSHAIVRINDETRWLSVGESLGQGFVVQSIRRTDSGSELEIVDSNNTQRRFIFKVN